jgi:CRP-like cAMP-binding protein
MSFETEPLILEPVRWFEQVGSVGVVDSHQRAIALPSFDSGDSELRPGELAMTLKSLLAAYSQASTAPTLQNLILHLRSSSSPPRLKAVYKAIEFLCDHSLIKNASAYQWVDLMRRDFQWRTSFALQPAFEIGVLKIPAGYAWPRTFRFLTVLLLLVGLISVFFLLGSLKKTLGDFSGQSGTLLVWALQIWLTISLARSLRALTLFILLNGLSGQSQSLRLQLSALLFSLETSSVNLIERKTAWEGIAGLASLSAMSLVAWLPFLHPSGIAYLFTLVAILLETSPFVRSPFLEILRYFYSLGEEQKQTANEESVISWHTAAAVIWILAAAGVIFAIGSVFIAPLRAQLPPNDVMRFSEYLQTWPRQTLLGFALLVWTILVILLSWLEDLFSGVLFGLDSEQSVVRRMFRVSSRRATDRPLREASEFADRKIWRELPLLRQLDSDLREALLANASVQTYPAGARLCSQGERRRELFILLSGQAMVVKRTRQGRAQTAAFLEEGAVFGEAAYFLDQPRTANVIAVSECVALRLPPDPRLANLDLSRFSDLQTRIWFLQSLQLSPIFRNVPAEALDALLFQGRAVRFRPPERLVSEGDVANAVYFVVQGHGRVFQKGQEISKMQSGDVIGEIALMVGGSQGVARTATVIADSEVIAIELDRTKFWQILSSHLPLGLVLENLAFARLARDRAR